MSSALLAALLALGAAAKPAPAPAAAPAAGPTPAGPAPGPAAKAGKEAKDGKPDAAEAAAVPPSTQEMYDDALGAHAKGDRRKAAGLLHAWLRGANRTSDRYESAEHLLAEDLAALGLTQAALSYEADVVRNRSRPELLPAALANLEAWTASAPHDEERVEEEILHGVDFGFLDGAPRAYVAFHQGALDLRSGNERWAQARFAELPAGSPYRARARLLTVVSHLAHGDAKGALAEFEALAAEPTAPREVRNDARIQAARLRFENGEFAAALALYDAVDLPELDPGRGQIYLEEAWTQYRLGQGGRAMGLLAALDAPSFKQLFLPEKFLLRALIFKDACQWLAAKRAARGLLRRYKPALEAIRERRPLALEESLAEAALQKGAARRLSLLSARLAEETELRRRLSGGWAESGLAERLAQLYSAIGAEVERRRQLALEKGVVAIADELLRASEQVNLVDYEVGLALYRRTAALGPQSTLTFQDETPQDGQWAFGFDGEYWNDELPALRFALANRCVEGAAP